jgi:DNA-directed RNA polymerase specialized sigma24 family protein
VSEENDRLSAEQLRQPDPRIWARVEAEVVPKVLAALRRQFGPGRHWLDVEGAVRSAERTAFRRVQDHADPNLEDLETFESFCRWLIGTAYNIILEKLRRMGVEEKHAPRIAHTGGERDRTMLDQLAEETAEQRVARVRASLTDQTDQAIFDGKLAQHDEVQIANDLGCSTRKVRNRWKRIKERLRQVETGTAS